MIVRKSMINPRWTAVDIKRETNTPLSLRSVQHRLIEAGGMAKKPLTKPLLTTKMRQARYQWAKIYRHWDTEEWKKVEFCCDCIPKYEK